MKIITFDRRLFQYLATLSGSLAVTTAGITSGWPSPYLPALLASTEIPTSSTQASWCAVMPLIGALPGTFLGSQILDRIGRKSSILATLPFLLASLLAIAFAKSIHLIIAARFVIGACEGCFYTAYPIYLAEISDPKIRGLLSSTLSVAGLLGILIINIIGPLTTIFTSSLITVAIGLAHACTFIWMPESPYFYIKKSKEAAARKSLEVLRGTPNIEQELASLYDAIKRQEVSNSKAKYWDLLSVKSNRKAVTIYVILSLTNRFCGKNPLVYYISMIFQAANAGLDSYLSVIIYNVVGILATILALCIIDKFGRRKLMLLSTAGCCISLAIQGLYFFLQEHSPESIASLNWLPLTTLICYNIIFCMGINFGPMLLLSELFPTSIKAKASGLGDALMAVTGVASSQFFYVTNDEFGMYVPFWAFSVCSAIGFIFIYYFLIETKGKTLEQIQLELLKL